MAIELSLPERVAILETKQAEDREVQKQILAKLDDLVQLKAKGVGAFWLVGLIAGTGILGWLAAIMQIFGGKNHL